MCKEKKVRLQENIEKIGYYKYETLNSTFSDLCDEYPMTDKIIEHIKKLNNVKIEFDGSHPKLVNGKFVALI